MRRRTASSPWTEGPGQEPDRSSLLLLRGNGPPTAPLSAVGGPCPLVGVSNPSISYPRSRRIVGEVRQEKSLDLLIVLNSGLRTYCGPNPFSNAGQAGHR